MTGGRAVSEPYYSQRVRNVCVSQRFFHLIWLPAISLHFHLSSESTSIIRQYYLFQRAVIICSLEGKCGFGRQLWQPSTGFMKCHLWANGGSRTCSYGATHITLPLFSPSPFPPFSPFHSFAFFFLSPLAHLLLLSPPGPFPMSPPLLPSPPLPLVQQEGLETCCKFSQWRLGQSPSRRRFYDLFDSWNHVWWQQI